MGVIRNRHKKLLARAFPDRDFSDIVKMKGRGKGSVYIAGSYCYKLFRRRHSAVALREAAMAGILRASIRDFEIPDMQAAEIAGGRWSVLHYRLIEGELAYGYSNADNLHIAWELGTLLAKIHTTSLDAVAPEKLSLISPLPPRRVRAWQLKKAKPLLDEKYRHYLDDHTLFLEDGTIYGHPHLLHGDFHYGNIIIRDGHVRGLIDFGCSQTTPDSYLDFRKIMYVMDRDFEDRLIAGYSATAGVEVDVAKVAAGLVARLCISHRWKLPLQWRDINRDRLRWAVKRMDAARTLSRPSNP